MCVCGYSHSYELAFSVANNSFHLAFLLKAVTNARNCSKHELRRFRLIPKYDRFAGGEVPWKSVIGLRL